MAALTASIAIPTWQYYALIMGMIVIPLITILMVFNIFKAVPWAWPMYRAFQKNVPVVWKHHPRGSSEISAAKIETDLKDGIPVTYYTVDKWGLKFSDIAGENTELLQGKLRVIHYFKNSPSPINVTDVVGIDQLCNWLRKKGVNITNREDAIIFILSEYTRTGNLKNAIASSKIDDDETKRAIVRAIQSIENNRDEVQSMKLKDGVFIFQTAMTAIDRTVSFTSAAFSNAKSAIEAQIRAKLAEDKTKELYRTIMILAALLVCAAIAYAIISKSGTL
jgi:hypothetical protein